MSSNTCQSEAKYGREQTLVHLKWAEEHLCECAHNVNDKFMLCNVVCMCCLFAISVQQSCVSSHYFLLNHFSVKLYAAP